MWNGRGSHQIPKHTVEVTGVAVAAVEGGSSMDRPTCTLFGRWMDGSVRDETTRACVQEGSLVYGGPYLITENGLRENKTSGSASGMGCESE